MLRTNLIGPRFGNVPVLAKKAAHVAARRAHAEDARARQKMAQRFFLDGINLQCGRRAVSQTVEFSALIHSNEAKARLAGPDVAVARTEVAVDFPRRLRLPPTGLVQRIRLLEDLQLFHGSSFSDSIIPLDRVVRGSKPRFEETVKARLRRGADAGSGAVPRPSPRSAPYCRGTSRQGERTCWASGWRLLFPKTFQSANAGMDSSKV